MSDVYKLLAEKLDEMPQRFPATDNGVEIKILKKLYRPEDAEMALKLKPGYETAETVGERIGKPAEETEAVLRGMAERGQIGWFKSGGKLRYGLAPFLPGIYEFQVYRLDKELVDMFEEYLPTLMKAVGEHGPGIARTVPINVQIEPGKQVRRYEDVRRMIEDSRSFRVIECICRQERAIEGHACDHTLENCLSFSREENAYDHLTAPGRTVNQEEALKILKAAEEEGLVHNAFYNVKDLHGSICNCCSCCCGVLRGFKEFGAPHVIARSNFAAFIDEDECSQCGVCADERCPMGAISEEETGYTVNPVLCIGCGVCTVACPTEAITLMERPEEEQNLPPDNMRAWVIARMSNRRDASAPQ